MATRQQRKQAVTELRRQQVLDAALAVFSRKGYGEATIADIAREGGMAVGTIYNYYAGKRQVLAAVLASRVLSQPFLRLLEGSAAADDRQFLRSLVEDRVNLFRGNGGQLLFLLNEICRDQELRRQWAREVVGPGLRRVEQYVGARVASGAFRPLDAGIAARAMAGIGIGFALLALIEGEDGPCREAPAADLAAQLAEIVLAGVRADRGGPPGGPGAL